MAGFLERLGEEPLLSVAARVSGWAIRVLVVPSFEPTMCVRVECGDGLGRLISIVGGEHGREPHSLTAQDLSSAECEVIQADLAGSGFWGMSSTGPQEGLDGEFWFVEAASVAEYRAVFRWSPDNPGPEAAFLRFGVHLLSLAGLGENVEGWLDEEF